MTYESWSLKPHLVELRDPDGQVRWWSVNAIGPFDARSQARHVWPLSEILDAREDNYPAPVVSEMSIGEICQRCTCRWEIAETGEANRKREWCREVDRDGCICHWPTFAASLLDRMDAEAKETPLAWIEPKDAA